MYGVLAEDVSDVEVLKILIRRMCNCSSLQIEQRGYGGCGDMLRKGARDLKLLQKLGCRRFIICYDSDGHDPESRKQQIMDRIVGPSPLAVDTCLSLVPVQELEAWILADIESAIPKVFPSWKPVAVKNPEAISSPKERLVSSSRTGNSKPIYIPSIHNRQVAKHLNLRYVAKRCRSFSPLSEFVAAQRNLATPTQLPPDSSTRMLYVFWVAADGTEQHEFIADGSSWGGFATVARSLKPRYDEARELCEYGSANAAPLHDELEQILARRPKSAVRAIIKRLQDTVPRDGVRIALDDGTR